MSKLAALRAGKGLTQLQIANAIGISRSAYAMFETGRRTPRPRTMKGLANFFGTTVDDLFFEDLGHDV